MVLILWACDCKLLHFRGLRLGGDFHSLSVNFSASKKASCYVPRTPGKNGLERTGLEAWTQATTSVSVRERQRKCCQPTSLFYFGGIGEGLELLTTSILWF